MTFEARPGCPTQNTNRAIEAFQIEAQTQKKKKNKKRPFCPLPWYLFVFLIKTPSDSLLRIVTGAKYCNLTSKNQKYHIEKYAPDEIRV